MHHRGNNAINQPGAIKVDLTLELAALEDLGPKTRSAICNSPLQTLAVSIISQVIEINDKIEAENEKRAALGMPQRPYLDPKQPELDINLARGVLEHNLNLLNRERSIEDSIAGVKPLRGRPSPRSIREQRKAMRRTRW